MSVSSRVIRRPISALVKVKNRTRSLDGAGDVFLPRKDRLIVVGVLFVAAAVTIGWMIGLAWGAITLVEWLFS